jgi:hypothetical protein
MNFPWSLALCVVVVSGHAVLDPRATSLIVMVTARHWIVAAFCFVFPVDSLHCILCYYCDCLHHGRESFFSLPGSVNINETLGRLNLQEGGVYLFVFLQDLKQMHKYQGALVLI